MIVQFGGQTPLRLAVSLIQAGVPIIGTHPEDIDRAEDRKRFKEVLEKLDLKQPANGTATSLEEAERIAESIGYPVVVRPSYVLGGRAMEIVYDAARLRHYMQHAVNASPEHPILIDQFLQQATEIDVDALSDGKDVFIGGLMEHIEEAGIHSGDSACSLPAFSLSDAVLSEIRQQTRALARELNVVGLINIQFAVQNGTVFIIEVNPRASRTVPFVSKAIGIPLAKRAAQVMAGKTLKELGLVEEKTVSHIAVKESVFPFNKFTNVDILLGPEMKSTGEVMGDRLPRSAGHSRNHRSPRESACPLPARCSSASRTGTRKPHSRWRRDSTRSAIPCLRPTAPATTWKSTASRWRA